MKVKEIMTSNPKACTPTTTLADAALLMWDADCGVLPVVTDDGKVVALITDRDICMATTIKYCSPADIAVEEVTSGIVYSVTSDDDVRKALEAMKEHKVRRVPVVDADQALVGMLSMNDVVLHAQDANEKKASGIPYTEVVKTYKAICEHRPRAQQAQAATAS